MREPTPAQRDVCLRMGAEPVAPAPNDVVGLGQVDRLPINGLRHRPSGQTSGWYIWGGGEIDAADDAFFRPVHHQHLEAVLEAVIRYLALPPGWRFQIAPDHEEVWFDASLLDLE
jgi:hypothetical protein